jgi:hypothetical protein
VYVGGNFTSIAGQSRGRLAAFDAATGNLTSWNPQPNDEVMGIAFAGGDVLIGGFFTTIAGVPRNHIGAIDSGTGAIESFNPNANEMVGGLFTRSVAAYVIGGFTEISGQSASRFGELRTNNGSATGFEVGDYDFLPNATQNNSLFYAGSTLWMGGADHPFTPDHSYALAAFDFPTSGVDNESCGSQLSLAPSAPHPARAGARIRFTLPEAGNVSLRVYDLRGRQVAAPIDGAWRAAGEHDVRLHTAGWQPGCYFYRLEAAGLSATRKLVVVP